MVVVLVVLLPLLLHCCRLSPPPTLHTHTPPPGAPTPWQAGIQLDTMWDVYRRTWLPFGGLLTDMEAVGMAVDRQHLADAQRQAETDQAEAKERFRWVGGCLVVSKWSLCIGFIASPGLPPPVRAWLLAPSHRLPHCCPVPR